MPIKQPSLLAPTEAAPETPEAPPSSPLRRPPPPGQPHQPQLGLLEPELHGPYTAWKADPTPKNSGALVSALKPVLDSAVRTYAGPAASQTLRSRAKLMALEAVGRYDPARAKLRTHLMVHLQGLRRHVARSQQVVGLPERVGLDLGRLHSGSTELTDRLGREPTDQELSDHTGLSRKRIGYVRQSKGSLAEGQLTQEGEGGEDVFQPAVTQTHGDDGWTELVYADLSPTDQTILEHSLGLHGRRKISKQQIAKKLRLSPGAISQRAARIQAMLDKKEELGVNFL